MWQAAMSRAFDGQGPAPVNKVGLDPASRPKTGEAKLLLYKE